MQTKFLGIGVNVHATFHELSLCSFHKCECAFEQLYVIVDHETGIVETWELGEAEILEVWNETTGQDLRYIV